jgi:transcriptional regulator with XRE-family HTH domain
MEVVRGGLNVGELGEGGLAAVAADSLARLGKAEARPLLVEAISRTESDSREPWAQRLLLLESILQRDARGILRAFDGGRGNVCASGSFAPCDRYWIELLVDTLPAEELARLATETATMSDADGRLVRAALRLRR